MSIDAEWYRKNIEWFEKRIQYIESTEGPIKLYKIEKTLLCNCLIDFINNGKQAIREDFWNYTRDLTKGDNNDESK